MSFFIVIVKECLETILRRVRLLKVKAQVSSVNNELANDGIVVQSGFYTPDECRKLRGKIDEYIINQNCNVWSDEVGADKRIYFINEIDSDFEKFYENQNVRDALTRYTGIDKPKGMLLAARIDAVPGNIGSGGGWHRDSPITHQFKAICYLNDVDERTGPFQYIKGSHKKFNVVKCYLSGLFKPGQFRFKDAEISNYLSKSDLRVTEVTGQEGTLVFADTKGIHRGKPIESGSRYVLFCYFWSEEIPEHFAQLRQL